MKAVVIEEYGGKEVLKEKEVSRPKAGKNQVVVKEYATSINPIDWKLREGYLKQMVDWEFPIILGWDVAGIVAEVGEGVTDFKVGDEVFARPETTRFGTYAEYTLVDAPLLARKPKEISFEEAASIPLAGLTAWQALFDYAKLKAGEKILIQAGAGGVGSLAVQFAKNAGAYVIATASAGNHQLVKELGADEIIEYKTTDFADVLTDIDVVFDTVGGEVQQKSVKVLKAETGRLVSIVGVDEKAEVMAKEKKVNIMDAWLKPNGKQLTEIGDLLAAGKVKAVIGETFPMSEKGVYAAHSLSETHHAVGKIVLTVSN